MTKVSYKFYQLKNDVKAMTNEKQSRRWTQPTK